MTHLITGTPAPTFTAEAPHNPRFVFGSLGGRYVLLAFVPQDPEGRAAADAAIARNADLFDDDQTCVFVVLRDRGEFSEKRYTTGLHWILDESGEIAGKYGAAEPLWVVVDPMQRVLLFGGIDQTDRIFAQLRRLPPPDRHGGAEVTAPVLVVPRVLEADFCARLIAHYHEVGGKPSGTMQQVGDRTVGVLSDFKKRHDANIIDESLQNQLRTRVLHRLLPEIRKAFQFEVTRIERYIVARYDSEDGGYFKRHRDNTTSGTAHRKFAVSINLNADFEGGDLRFPEFGARTYRPPPGGAVVFSCSLLHEATPVTRGVRYATLPFLYDEAGAAIRAANRHTFADGLEPPLAAEMRQET